MLLIFCFLVLLVMDIIGLTMSFVINTERTRRTGNIESGSIKILPGLKKVCCKAMDNKRHWRN